MKTIFGTVLSITLLLQPIAVPGFETDQYNLPLDPLADIGDEVTEYTLRNISEAIGKINGQILKIQNCSAKTGENASAKKDCELAKLDYLRSENAAANAVYKEMGSGFIAHTKSSWWMEEHKFSSRNSRFKTKFSNSIYLTAPFNYLTISSTVNLYGSEFGTDKIAHIFQQGYDYHKIYKKALRKGMSKEEAIAKAVKWGRKTEDTYFGTWVSGVYSNADLYSNYAALKFYMGLTRELKIGEETRPATLELENGLWKLNDNENVRESLLRPFISNHLNEAYNPNKYFNLLNFRKVIRGVVKKQSCKQWKERYPGLTKEELEIETKSVELWHGEDYGFSFSNHFITIANTCFGNEPSVGKTSAAASRQ